MYTRWSPELKNWLKRHGTKALQLGDLNYHVPAGLHQKDLLSIGSRIDEIVDNGQIIKKEKHSIASVFTINQVSFFAKHVRFNEKAFHSRLRYIINPSRGYWCALIAEQIEKSGLHTPRVLAVGDRRRLGLVSDSYIITEFLADAKTADEVLLSQPNSLALLEQAGQLLKRLHSCGITHGDIKLSNFYVLGDEMGFWDLDSAMMFSSFPSQKWIVRDLGRLLSSFTLIVDEMKETEDSFFSIKHFAHTLANSYGIEESVILNYLESYWFKKMKLKHRALKI